MLGLDYVQPDEGVVAVQNSQQQVHPLQRGSDTESARQAPESGLRQETATLKPRDQEVDAMLLQHAIQPLRRRFLSCRTVSGVKPGKYETELTFSLLLILLDNLYSV